jgi:hypothetical protein
MAIVTCPHIIRMASCNLFGSLAIQRVSAFRFRVEIIHFILSVGILGGGAWFSFAVGVDGVNEA